MEPYVAWIDYSSAEQERMRQALALLKSQDTRDELGLGMIRDSLADLLFPGTSTIQTRLRYFLIVPWLYRELEASGSVTAARIANSIVRAEKNLIPRLREEPGAFGKVAGERIQRLPSSVYWAGLQRWGIFRQNWSQARLHEAWDEVKEHNRGVLIPEDGGIAPRYISLWDPRLPSPPAGWKENITLEMSPDEALYLKGRMELLDGSLLAHIAEHRADLEADYLWNAIGNLPPKLAEMLRQAQAFSLLMYGAARLYNVALCRQSEHEHHRDKLEDHEEKMADWADTMVGFEREWEPAELWSFLEGEQLVISSNRPDRLFVESWFDLLRRRGPRALATDEAARDLIRKREWNLKQNRARLHNANRLATWGGSSGTAFIDYRWFRVRGLLADLYQGLDRSQGGA